MFEIHQRLKCNFFNELRVSFKKKIVCGNLTSEAMWHNIWEICVFFKIHVFLRNTFSKAGSMFLKISSVGAWNVSYKFWFTPSPKNSYLQYAQLCFFFFFFQISSKLNLFSCRDCVYSLRMILSVCFNVKKPLELTHL